MALYRIGTVRNPDRSVFPFQNIAILGAVKVMLQVWNYLWAESPQYPRISLSFPAPPEHLSRL